MLEGGEEESGWVEFHPTNVTINMEQRQHDAVLKIERHVTDQREACASSKVT